MAQSGGDLTVDAKFLAEFRTVATSLLSDNLHRLPGAVGLRPFHNSGAMVGVALTVKTPAGDNMAVHQALEVLKPGQVIVIDGGGEVGRAIFGEIMATLAKVRGAAGVVIDGAIRDAKAISALGLPCFARATIHKGPYKNGPGELNVPVAIGGMVVNPGDIIVGDEDGVVAFAPAVAAQLLKAARSQEEHEAAILKSIHAGTYVSPYLRK